MKQTCLLIALVLGAAGAWADELVTKAVPTVQATSAPAAEVSTPVPEAGASAPAPVITEHEGSIRKMQECSGAAGNGQRVGNVASNAVAQVAQKTFLGTLWRMAAADAAGRVVGTALDDAPETRQVCITITFKDGTEDQVTRLPGKQFDALHLSYRQKVLVRFEDGKARDFRL